MNLLSKIKSAIFGVLPDTSTKGKVDSTDLVKVVRTGLFLSFGSFVTYMLSNVQPEMFGDHAAVATVVLALAAELAARYFKGEKKEK
jgi:hypothetical protein